MNDYANGPVVDKEPKTLMNSVSRLSCTVDSLNNALELSKTLVEKLDRTYDTPKTACACESVPFSERPTIVDLFNNLNDTLAILTNGIERNIRLATNMIE
jgi:hypothetical protein